MPETNDLNTDPFIFTMSGPVEFAGEDAAKKNLRLTLYDGSIVPHWYWGSLAFDMKTMKMAKRRNPILFNHDVDQRIAYSDTAEFEPKFVMEGRFLKSSDIGEQVRGQMEEGFPFESSLRFDPDRSGIEFVKEGQSVEVNGHKLKGPGTIIRNALILEGSVCVFGALKNTKSQAFAENPIFKEHTIMAKETDSKMTVDELTVENFAGKCPDLHLAIVEQALADGVKAEKERFTKLQEVCGDDAALVVKCFAEGTTPTAASTLRMAGLEAENKRIAEENASLKAAKVDPAKAEFSDTAAAPGTPAAGDKFDEDAATDEQLKEHFEKTKDLQDNFTGPDAYVAYVRHKD